MTARLEGTGTHKEERASGYGMGGWMDGWMVIVTEGRVNWGVTFDAGGLD